MTTEQPEQQGLIFQRMAEEEQVQEKIDKNGNRWIKVYFGGGAHYRNWLSQFIELKGEDNVQVEEADSTGFQCFEESGEKMYRIWVKDDINTDRCTEHVGNFDLPGKCPHRKRIDVK